jgi:hypothetical protein
MFIIVHCNELDLSTCKGSRVFSINQNVNFKFQLPTMIVFLVSSKRGSSSEVLSVSKIP